MQEWKMSERRYANTKLYKCVIQTQRESKIRITLFLNSITKHY